MSPRTSTAIDTTATTELVPVVVDDNDTAVSIVRSVNTVDAVWDDLDDLDMVEGDTGAARVPFIRTNGNIDGGLYIDDQQVDEIYCVIAARANSRAKFEKTWDEDKNARPVCWSSNGTTPDDTVPEDQRGAARCATCPFSFEHAVDRKHACKKNLELLAYVPNASDIAVMRFRIGGISVKHAMRYWESFASRMPKKHPVGFVTRVTMVPEDTDNGRKLRTSFERGFELTRDDVAVFIADARNRRTIWQEMVAADVIDTSAQSNDGPDQGGPFESPQSDPETGEVIGPRTNAQRRTPDYAGPDEEPF